MQIPASPTILLAAASIAILFGRLLHIRIRRIWGLLISILLLSVVGLLESFGSVHAVSGIDAKVVFIDDVLARSEQWLIVVFGLLVGISVFDSPHNEQATLSLYGFLLFAVAAMLLVARANDFLALGLSLEIVNLVLVAVRQPAESRMPEKKAVKDDTRFGHREVRFSWIVSGLMWIGIAILSSVTSTTNFDEIHQVLVDAYNPAVDRIAIGAPSKMILLAAGLIAMSLFARMGLVPFHLGFSADQNQSCPAMLSFSRLAQTLAAQIALTRLFGLTFSGLGQSFTTLMMTVCLASFVVTSVVAVRGRSPGVKSIPYWVASLTLLQGAWYGVGLMIASTELENPGLRWGSFESQTETLAICVYTQFVSLLSCGGIYWTLGHLHRVDRETTYLEDVKGLVQFAPVASFSLMIALACGIGVPLTAGFWGRWLLLLAGHSVHVKASNIYTPHPALHFIMLAGTIATLIVATVVIRLAREMFLESPLARPTAVGGRGSLISGAMTAAIILLLGVAPQILLVPLNAIRPSRVVTPESHQKGSGQVPMGFIGSAKSRSDRS